MTRLSAVADDLNGRNVTTARDGRWHGSTVRRINRTAAAVEGHNVRRSYFQRLALGLIALLLSGLVWWPFYLLGAPGWTFWIPFVVASVLVHRWADRNIEA